MDRAPALAADGGDLRRVAANSAIGSLWTTVSRVTGLLRVVAVGAVLGPTFFANLYAAANQLPSLAFELLTGALLGSLVVPALVRHLDRGRPGAAEFMASSFLTLAVLAALAVVAVPILAGPLVLDLLTAGVPDEARAPGTGPAWLLLALLLLQVPLYLVAGMGAAVQHAHGRFGLAAAAPCAENLGIVAVLAVYAAVFGTGATAGQGTAEVALLGAGTTGAVLLHAAVQWEGARRCGVRLRPRFRGARDGEVRDLLRLVRPSLGYAAATTVRYLCVLVVTAAVPGGVVAFTMAYAFYNLPVALVARPVASATLPVLARAHHRGDDAAFAATFRRTASLVLLATLPAALWYVLLSGPLATAVAFGEMAGDTGRAALTACLVGLGIGVVGESAVVLGTQAGYARRNGTHPLRAVVLRAALAIAGMLAAALLLDGPALLVGVALSVAVSDLLAGALLWWWVGRPAGAAPSPGSWRGTVLRPVTAGLVSLAPMLGVMALIGNPASQAAAVGLVLAAGAVGLASYVAAHAVLRTPELRELTAAVRARRRGGAAHG
ncbi:murein biosynthesis integral membrane protein MurJ [Blastococcus sp. PRF04-17]|uniref:murein biosynthesis integral membrane protein MurJ n=1 Tax=Blastococcus sp. PRF04-17 TaxID=2933797 RepID=UPI001FF5CDD8|nr:lipid II flippase MurJ [Blastococcus sp. PRF04-17]UOY00206.1 hypothetical protein MVA48_14470 [Blastococcus sp. PRF04-17]